ncbi:FliH/SctL family protein [Rhizobium etli]|uniref:Flagellar assembly protein FliH n=1 Tax=Rhizobium etli TaxID=29449 RepID=A0A7W6VFQ0_RHIET|nr:FliH/SctL family protein [Rhizobium etli]AJC82194.1 type III secretion system FliH/HrpE family protein [Rhizobium etli bv. phaseoli str. IE4803]MBB4483479.1 type III secretion protein L [Rhizobium etli]MBB4539300.1 type III secretion protein L [Rhizobium etli]
MVALVQLTLGSCGILGPGRILPAERAQALVDAEQMLVQARREADALIDAARLSAQAIEAAAKEAGLVAAQAAIEARLTGIAMNSLRIMAQCEEQIVDMGLQIARRIIETIEPEEATVQIALRGLKFTRHNSLVRLRVAPSLLEAVRDRLAEIIPTATSRAIVDLVADARVTDAGCILETDAGLVDATIESQLAAIENCLLSNLAASAKLKHSNI